jgi:hypothetical protein
MIWAGFRLAASRHPATSSFPHQPVCNSPTNPFRFIALHTLFSDGNSLPSSFQQLTHSFPSHGTRPSPQPNFHPPISNFPLLLSRAHAERSQVHLLSAVNCRLSTRFFLSSFFATLTDSNSRNSFICHSYENTGGGTHLFPFWNSQRQRQTSPVPAFLISSLSQARFRACPQRFLRRLVFRGSLSKELR